MSRVFSVSQVNSYIRRIFESDYALKNICIKGEVSNCKYHSSRHVYFTLKDEKSSLRCIMFAGDRLKGLHFKMENGQSVIVSGRISVFDRDGSYQLYAKEIELSGIGMLYLKYEQLKEELLEKGYFDFEHKKPIPAYPKKIGIVTALTGAAIEDIKSVALRRNPYIQLYLYSAKVQGEGAAQTIAEGIRYFDRFGVDVIIIGRGGGSIEDLWAFNERCVAEAIYQADTPIISGTGHEIDLTIADYCADLRAPTPSAACEMAIPDIFSILQQLDYYQERLERILQDRIQNMRYQITIYERMLRACHPGSILADQRKTAEYYEQKLSAQIQQIISDKRHILALYTQKLQTLSPTARLGGGYVFAQSKDGTPINSIGQLSEQETIELTLKDGKAEVIPCAIHPL